MPGMAYVDVVFDSASGLDAARQEIVERVDAARARAAAERAPLRRPGGVEHRLGLRVRADRSARCVSSLLELRRFQEDVLRPALAAIPGVAEVASVGGDVRQVRVDVKPRELRERGLAFTDVLGARVRAALATPADARPRERLARRISSRCRSARPARGATAGAACGDVALVRAGRGHADRLADVAGVARGRRHRGRPARRRHRRRSSTQVKRVIAREARKLPHRAADPERLDSGAAADVHVATTYDRAELATRVRKTLLRALGRGGRASSCW